MLSEFLHILHQTDFLCSILVVLFFFFLSFIWCRCISVRACMCKHETAPTSLLSHWLCILSIPWEITSIVLSIVNEGSYSLSLISWTESSQHSFSYGMIVYTLKTVWWNPFSEGWLCSVVWFVMSPCVCCKLHFFLLSTSKVAFLMFKFAPMWIRSLNHQGFQKVILIQVAVLDNVKIPCAV